tara:strand:- start:77 stop:634 length:558 start_codon:yes stop_codon:yes gene_type:complete
MFRHLSENEKENFKKWARNNYVVGDPIPNFWHTVVQDECLLMIQEANEKADEYISVENVISNESEWERTIMYYSQWIGVSMRFQDTETEEYVHGTVKAVVWTNFEEDGTHDIIEIFFHVLPSPGESDFTGLPWGDEELLVHAATLHAPSTLLVPIEGKMLPHLKGWVYRNSPEDDWTVVLVTLPI